MRFRITSQKDFWAGTLFLTIGCIAALVAMRYPTGTPSRMGPGFFPLMLSSILALVGVVMLVRSAVAVEVPPRGFRPIAILCVLGGAALFAGLVDVIGLAPTSALVIVATFAGGWDFSWRRMAALAAGMAVFVVVLFVLLLKMQFRIWPAPWS